jgi:hypothetical protein
MKFEVDDAQMIRFERWRKEMKEKNSFIPTAGERWTFCFTPTGLGTVVEAVDNTTKERLDLTEWNSW